MNKKVKSKSYLKKNLFYNFYSIFTKYSINQYQINFIKSLLYIKIFKKQLNTFKKQLNAFQKVLNFILLILNDKKDIKVPDNKKFLNINTL